MRASSFLSMAIVLLRRELWGVGVWGVGWAGVFAGAFGGGRQSPDAALGAILGSGALASWRTPRASLWWWPCALLSPEFFPANREARVTSNFGVCGGENALGWGMEVVATKQCKGNGLWWT